MSNNKIIKCYPKGIYKFVNEMTVKLDKLVLEKSRIRIFYTYIYGKKINNCYVIRYPGASRGCIEVDDNDVITGIKIYDTNGIYSELAKETLEEYIGYTLIFN